MRDCKSCPDCSGPLDYVEPPHDPFEPAIVDGTYRCPKCRMYYLSMKGKLGSCRGCSILGEDRVPKPLQPEGIYRDGWPLVMFVGHAPQRGVPLLGVGKGLLKGCLERHIIAAYLTDSYRCERNYENHQTYGPPGLFCRQFFRKELSQLKPALIATIGQSCQVLFDRLPREKEGVFETACFPHKYLTDRGPIVKAIMFHHPSNQVSVLEFWFDRWQKMIAYLESLKLEGRHSR